MTNCQVIFGQDEIWLPIPAVTYARKLQGVIFVLLWLLCNEQVSKNSFV